MHLHEHAAHITEQKQRRRAGALAKRSRASSPAASSSSEGTDTGASVRRHRTMRPMSDEDASATSVLSGYTPGLIDSLSKTSTE
jgi:hypothetical protein